MRRRGASGRLAKAGPQFAYRGKLRGPGAIKARRLSYQYNICRLGAELTNSDASPFPALFFRID